MARHVREDEKTDMLLQLDDIVERQPHFHVFPTLSIPSKFYCKLNCEINGPSTNSRL